MLATAPAAARNATPILEVLNYELPRPCRLLEIGSGTGLHATRAAELMPQVEWHASEVPVALAQLKACLADEVPAIGERAIALDVDSPSPAGAGFDAAYSCNTAHIMSLESVERMFTRVAEMTQGAAVFLLYGPFRVGGRYSSESNAQFDASLRARDAAMGLRDLEQLDGFADATGFERLRLYSMPSNNLMVVWRRRQSAENMSQLSD